MSKKILAFGPDWMIFIVLFVLVFLVSDVFCQQKGPGYRLIEKPSDVKEFKKLLRTKTNVLVLFCSKGEIHPTAKTWIPILSEAADGAFGKGTIAIVDCGSDEGKKLCKKYKVSPDPVALKHYNNGEYHMDYDRMATSRSVINFLLDPTGDLPWEEDSSAGDVVHLLDPGVSSQIKILY